MHKVIEELIQSTSLNLRIVSYLGLEKVISSIIENYNLESSIIENAIFESTYDVLENVIVHQFNGYKEFAKNDNNFEANVLIFKELMNLEEYVPDLFLKYPLLKRIMYILINGVLKEIELMLYDFEEEKEDIKNTFSIDNDKINCIKFNLGDKHNNRSVAKVCIGKSELFYKPRKSLTDSLLNDCLRFMENYKVTDFKKIKSLVKSDHTWQESIACKQSLSENDAKLYYYRAGVLLAIITCLRGTDIHYENIIVSGTYPMIIDTETLLSPGFGKDVRINNGKSMEDSVLATAMLPLKDVLYDVEVSGLFPKITQSKSIRYRELTQNNGFRYEEKLAKSGIGRNAVLVNGNIVNHDLVLDDLILGFRTGMKTIMAHKEDFVALLNNVDYSELFVKKILRGTQVYHTFLQESINPVLLMEEKEYEKVFKVLLKNFKPSNFGYLRVEEEIKSLKELNIPAFHVKINDRNLYANGKVLCEDYFHLSPLENALDAIHKLDDNMIEYQVDLIKMSIFANGVKEKDINNLYLDKKFSIKSPNDFSFVKKIINREIIDIDYDISTVYITGISDGELEIKLLDAGLYMGGGIVHLLYTYAYVYNNSIAKETVRRLINGLYERISKLSIDDFAFLGAYNGMGGFLYLSYNYYLIFGDIQIYDKFIFVLNRLLKKLQNMSFRNADYDYVNGIGSLIHLLSKLYFEENDLYKYKKLIKEILYKYCLFLNMAKIFDYGLAHGASGVCLNYSYMYRILEDDSIINSYSENVTKENMDYTRANALRNGAWCRGLTGIMISKTIQRNNLGASGNSKLIALNNSFFEKFVEKEIFESCLKNNSLSFCHGITGSIDALMFFKRKGVISRNIQVEKTFGYKYALNNYEWFKKSNYEFESFMLGKSGALYTLLHERFDVPAISALEFFNEL